MSVARSAEFATVFAAMSCAELWPPDERGDTGRLLPDGNLWKAPLLNGSNVHARRNAVRFLQSL
jgi:hypothetical protein